MLIISNYVNESLRFCVVNDPKKWVWENTYLKIVILSLFVISNVIILLYTVYIYELKKNISCSFGII